MPETALVVHPDPAVLEMARGVLVEARFEAITATSALDALERCGMEPVDVLVLGLSELDERDLEAVNVLRRRWRDARMLVLLPASRRDRAGRVIGCGADAYLPEPFHPGELTALARPGGALPASVPAPATAGELEALVHDRSRRAVDDLAGRVAHNVRNPLQILEFLVAGVEMGDALDLEGFRKELRRIGQVVDDLTRASGTKVPAVETVDVNELARSVFQQTPEMNGLQVELELADGPLAVRGSAKRLGLALAILRSRAQRVSDPQGSVSVRTTRTAGPEGAQIEIAVEDHGEPPDDDGLRRMFGAAPDDDLSKGGADYELDAFAQIIRDHGGQAEARRGPRQGTEILARLPSGSDPESATRHLD